MKFRLRLFLNLKIRHSYHDNMIKNIALFSFIFILCSNFAIAQTADKQIKSISDDKFANEAGKWFSAWELISKDVYAVNKLEPVEFVFFDDRYVYSTSNVTVPEGEIVNGPRLLKKSFIWKKSPHNGSITLPDKRAVPIGLMSFASELPGIKNNSFFVMPLPDFWRKASVKRVELGLDNLITGVFLHEFSHSQQMRNFGKQISEFEKNNRFETDVSDNIVQDLFGKDSAYIDLYAKEVRAFYDAANEKNKAARDSLIKNGINLLRKRHSVFFTEKYENLKQIDECFLTMEGVGQFTMYKWLTHKRGANLPTEIAVKGVRRGGKQWSQDEGLTLFLILENFSKPKNWAGKMFGTETHSVIDLIEQELRINKNHRN